MMTLALLTHTAHADDEGIQADRPDFTNGPDPMPVRVGQVEAGWTHEHATPVHTDGTFGLAVFRYGVAPRVELRADIPSWIRSHQGPVYDSGFGDAGIGTKVLLAEGHGGWPRLGLIADIDLPTGAEAFKSDGAGYNTTLAAERQVGAIDASANVLAGNDDDTGERQWTTGASLSLGFTPVKKLDAFAEWYILAFGSAGPQNFLDTGATLPVGHHFLIDTSVGTGVGSGTQPWFVGAGGTWRW